MNKHELTFAIVTIFWIVFSILLGCSKSFVVYSPKMGGDTTEVYIPRKVKGVGDTLVPITFSVEVENWWEVQHDTIVVK